MKGDRKPDPTPRFDQSAKPVLRLAQEEMERDGHKVINTEHLLLAMLREENGLAGQVLRAVGLDSEQVEALLRGPRRYADAAPEETIVEQPLLIFDEWGKLLVANQPAQDLLNNHMTDVVDRIGQSGGTAQVRVSDRTYLAMPVRLSDTITLRILRDVTEIVKWKRDEQAIFYTVNNELRGPLHAIEGLATLLPQVTQLNDKGQSFVEHIVKSAHKGVDILDDMIVMTRLRGILEIEYEPCNLCELANSAIAELQRAARRHSVRFTLELPSGDCRASGDPFLLRRMIVCLLKNAFDAYDSEAIKIILTCDSNGAYLAAQDQGSTLSESELAHAFDNFVRLPGRTPGLQLSFVKRIAEAHGSTVEVRNLPEGGVEFGVRFPASMILS